MQMSKNVNNDVSMNPPIDSILNQWPNLISGKGFAIQIHLNFERFSTIN